MQRKSVLILANGVWGDDEFARALRCGATVCLATDGAWSRARRAGIPVDAVVGDMDSLDEEERVLLEASSVPVFSFPSDKDWTDLELAVDRALALSPSEIVLYGALGGRIDHALAATHLLEKGLDAGVPMRLVDDCATLRLLDAAYEWSDAQVGDVLSLLPISETAEVATRGLRYPLHRETLQRAASRGISNVVDSLPVRVDVTAGRLLAVHIRAGGAG